LILCQQVTALDVKPPHVIIDVQGRPLVTVVAEVGSKPIPVEATQEVPQRDFGIDVYSVGRAAMITPPQRRGNYPPINRADYFDGSTGEFFA